MWRCFRLAPRFCSQRGHAPAATRATDGPSPRSAWRYPSAVFCGWYVGSMTPAASPCGKCRSMQRWGRRRLWARALGIDNLVLSFSSARAGRVGPGEKAQVGARGIGPRDATRGFGVESWVRQSHSSGTGRVNRSRAGRADGLDLRGRCASELACQTVTNQVAFGNDLWDVCGRVFLESGFGVVPKVIPKAIPRVALDSHSCIDSETYFWTDLD